MTAALELPAIVGRFPLGRFDLAAPEELHVGAGVHTDAAARRLGFRSALIPATSVYAAALRPAAERWGEAWFTRATAVLRHRRPVYSGEELFVTFGAAGTGRAATVRVDNRANESVALGHVTARTDDDPWATGPPPSGAVERAVVRPGGMRPGMAVAYRPRPLDTALLRVFAGPGVDAGSLSGVELALAMHIATRAGFESFEHIGPGLHYEGGIHYLGRANVGCTIEGRGVIRAVYERNGNHYYDSVVHVLADHRTIAVAEQTVLYARAGEPA
jgi:hypothetical protein